MSSCVIVKCWSWKGPWESITPVCFCFSVRKRRFRKTDSLLKVTQAREDRSHVPWALTLCSFQMPEILTGITCPLTAP